MADQSMLQKMFNNSGFSDYRWIDPKEIHLAQWVRVKQMFGSDHYGRNASSPPNTPSLQECREFFSEYRLGTLLRIAQTFDDLEQRHAWSREVNRALAELEQSIFLAGYPQAFVMFMDTCNLCRECTNTRASCRNKKLARPTAEGMNIDIYATGAKYDFIIKVLNEHATEVDGFALLLIE